MTASLRHRRNCRPCRPQMWCRASWRLHQMQQHGFDPEREHIRKMNREKWWKILERKEKEKRKKLSPGPEVPPQPIPPTPLRLVVLGPGGTGKSFLIRVLMLAIRKWAMVRIITKPSPQRGVVLAAPTGIAAFNVGGATIHSAFNLMVEKVGRNSFNRL